MMKRFKLLSMAALVALSVAACDEGEDTLTPDVTGTITGVVSVDGTGRAGATVTLSTGVTTTTNATGSYTFGDVPSGAYSVTVSGLPAGTQCPATSLAVVIGTNGQAVQANFPCTSVRNSSIVATVSGASGPLAGVTVTLSGAGTGTATTSTAGIASFTGLAAGTYTVAISGVPAGQLCSVTSQSTTVPAGETRSVAFTCSSSTTGSITGRLFIDENNKNNVFDGATLEQNVAAANVAITLEGPTIGVTRTTQTDANGNFSFTGLAAGQYNVSVDSDDPDLPDNVEYGLNSETIGPITLAAGGTATANFPFDIVTQTVLVYAFLGRDSNAAPNIDPSIPTGVAPVEGVIIELYPTQEDADDGTNRLDRDTTNAAGEVQLTFDREDDTAPGTGGQDQIVFARIRTPLPTGMTRNGESQFEIRYSGGSATTMAPDTFDLLHTSAVIAVDVVGLNGEPLENWQLRLRTDTTSTAIAMAVTDSLGRAEFAIDTTIGSLPVDYYIRLADAQPAAGGADWTAQPIADEGSVAGRYLKYTHTGTVAVSDTADVGDFRVSFTETDVVVQLYHERDDTVGFTAGDNVQSSGGIDLTLTFAGGDSTRTANADPLTGIAVFQNVPINRGPYILVAEDAGARIVLEEDSLVIGTGGARGDLSGGDFETEICIVSSPGDCGTFAYKFNNGAIAGNVLSSTGGEINNIRVRIQPHPMTIQPAMTDTTVKVAAGTPTAADTMFVTNPNLREGLYIVTALDSITSTGDTVWRIDGPRVDTVDVQGANDTAIASFTATRLDTQVRGLVVNDRDGDQNTIDLNEALPGVVLRIYRDGSGAFTRDTLVQTDTTDANGAFQFTRLPEGRYMVKVATQATGAVALRGFMGSGGTTPIDSVIVTTTSTTAAACVDVDMVHRVGEDNQACFGATNPLPRWDYAANAPVAATLVPTHFTFLHSNGTATGTILRATNSAPIVGMSVVIRRCAVSTAPANPTPGTCTTYVPGFTGQTVVTDASGRYTFSGLQEGVYQIEPQTGTGTPGTTSVTPQGGVAGQSTVVTINQPGDIETANFTAAP
jgi:hypothetical protein